MSTLFNITTEVDISNSILDEVTTDNNNKYHSYNKYGLKHKNLSKHRQRCKVLRKKLKKYKLRKHGEEDQDVLEVSGLLNSNLVIKSPQKKNCKDFDSELVGIETKNYLFEMARRKHKAKTEKLNVSQIFDPPSDINVAGISPVSSSQDLKKTNAFKLMMDSRNKSIGSNSPGKEKDIDPSDLQEITEKKNLKAKRNLVLQKMAEAKGSLKKIEMEQLQENCIQKKMEKRAERLKEMITNTKERKAKKSNKKSKPDGDKVNGPFNNTVLLFDIFKDVFKGPMNISPEKKYLSKEDEEFMKKLSPSLKKKENMHSYFKKIEKEPESIDDIDPELNKSPILKVKFTTKNKKKLKKRKLSLKKEDPGEIKHHNENEPCINGINGNKIEQKENNTERRKRKRKEHLLKELGENNEINNGLQSKLEVRPKRNVRKPVKYIDDVQLNSSDEELHVFTPKKKRHVENKEKTAAKDMDCENVIIIDDKPKKNAVQSKKVNTEIKQQNPTKLAPIFTTKPLLNQEQLEARHNFLYSGVPDQLKKIAAQEKNTNTESTNCFPIVVHVQQMDIIKMPKSNILIAPFTMNGDDYNEKAIADNSNLFHHLIKLTEKKHSHCMEKRKNSISTVLHSLKECYPKFPVYRTYRLLSGVSKGEIKENTTDLENSVEIVNSLSQTINEDHEQLNWTYKYKPKSTKNMLGNFESIRELKKWLECWTENLSKIKSTLGSDLSDFYDSDTDSTNSIKTANNLLILTGPLGSGKTSSVYAVAAELAMKVIEVNASSKRTGKMMLQDLQEATQSHKVNRDNSQKAQEVVEIFTLKTYKRKGRPKKKPDENPKPVDKKETFSQQSTNQEVGRTAMSLILIDDADIVFDQDDGFSSAIAQLVQSSKRPVVLVTASLSCSHLQRFLQYAKVIKMRPFSPRVLGTWLDLLCLADSGSCWPGLGAKFLDYFKGDIRKSINNLQFYMTTQEMANDVTTSQNSDIKSSLEDENSCSSWVDGAESGSVVPKFTIGLENEVWTSFTQQQSNLLHPAGSLKLMDLWWNMPSYFNNSSELRTQNSCKNSQKQSFELKAIGDIIDTLSMSDYFSQLTPDTSRNISSLPWSTSESDSVSENENSDGYSRSNEIRNEIMHHLTTSSVLEAQKVFGLEKDIEIQFLNMATQR